MSNGFYTANYDILPKQMVPLKEKLADGKDGEKSWKQKCMDALETIGKSQYNRNLKLIENYEMIKGRFIYDHYFHSEGYSSMISELSKEFELPNYLRHYDIISPVINELVGEWIEKPDMFRVKQLGDGATNEYLRTKTELTKQWALQKINAEINKRLIEQGLDPNKQDFPTEEEALQYRQQIAQTKQNMTPLEIQRFMDTDFLTQAEIWGQHQYQLDRELFNLPEKEKVEIEDYLVADRCFRHFYLTPTGYGQETWNPINTFFQASPDVKDVELGDYVGRIFLLSLPTIIDRYGHDMSKDDFDMLCGKESENNTKWEDSQFNWVYDNYMVPFKGYKGYEIMKDQWNTYKDGQIPFINEDWYSNLTSDNVLGGREGYYFVTEAYWRSQKKIIKITYWDEETQQIAVEIVDENFIMPDFFVESERPFDEEQSINSYVETWVNEVWRGVKINTGVDKQLRKDLYLKVQPHEFQFKGDFNIYGCKLPVCGQVFSVRNSCSMSLVDMMKPHQIGYNVSMNQLYQIAEKEVGMFVVFDVNMFPNSKDWGGEDAWEKWMMVAKNLGMLPADTSPQNLKNSLAANGGTLPKVLDLNLATQMVSRMNMAKFFQEQALQQVGFNEYRLGNFKQSSTATGIKEGMDRSYSQTESYFTNFSNYLRRCASMGLSMAQYVQSQKNDVSFTYTKSDMSRAFIKVLGTELLLADLGVFVSNSQEQRRQLDMMRQYALGNNTAGMSPVDVTDIIMMNSPSEIRRQLNVSYQKVLENQNKQYELAQQQLEQEKQMKIADLQNENNENQLDRAVKLDVAKINAGVAVLNSNDPVPSQDMSAEKMMLDKEKVNLDTNTKAERLSLDKQVARVDEDYKLKKLALESQKIAASLQIQRQETETARIMKGKEDKK